jgi:hypothetical protein
MPAVVKQLAGLKSIEGEELTTSANPEGYVSVAPNVDPATATPLTVVSAYPHSGLGGSLAVEVYGDRGIQKAHGGDGVFELSNGGKYVLPLELAEAIGAAIPDPPVSFEDQAREFAGLLPKTDEGETSEEQETRAESGLL